MLQELRHLQQQQQVPSISKHLPKYLSSRLLYSLIKMDVDEYCHDVLMLSEEAAEEVVEQGITD